jgi:8-oxo-dGTP pyrophosphatase MutT (NUDIX family)
MTIAFKQGRNGWPADNTVIALRGVELLVEEGDHPFLIAQRAEIDENWRREIAANPALFNGNMVFQREISIEDGVLKGKSHVSPFSSFMWWRKQPQPVVGTHLFAFAVPVSSDGAIIAVRMSAHTANPGQVYCAAGSLDDLDIVDGRCDLDANMAREVREETGIDLADARADAQLYTFQVAQRFTVFRFYHFTETADELVAKIEAHMLVDEEQEIDAVLAIRSADPAAHSYSQAMPPILEFFFRDRA